MQSKNIIYDSRDMTVYIDIYGKNFPPLKITFRIIQSDASWSIVSPNKLFTTIKNKYLTASDKIGKKLAKTAKFELSDLEKLPVERFNRIYILAVSLGSFIPK